MGVIRRYGPFFYGFSYTAEQGKEPVFREFGNIRPSYRGIEPSQGRESALDAEFISTQLPIRKYLLYKEIDMHNGN
jgi:hypothetical protein